MLLQLFLTSILLSPQMSVYVKFSAAGARTWSHHISNKWRCIAKTIATIFPRWWWRNDHFFLLPIKITIQNATIVCFDEHSSHIHTGFFISLSNLMRWISVGVRATNFGFSPSFFGFFSSTDSIFLSLINKNKCLICIEMLEIQLVHSLLSILLYKLSDRAVKLWQNVWVGNTLY